LKFTEIGVENYFFIVDDKALRSSWCRVSLTWTLVSMEETMMMMRFGVVVFTWLVVGASGLWGVNLAKSVE
jgi:hypothetical protein